MISLSISVLLWLSLFVTSNSYSMQNESQGLIALQEELMHQAQSMVSGRNARVGSRARLNKDLKESSPRKFANGIITELDQQLLAELRKKGVTDELLQKHRDIASREMENEYTERKKNRQPASSPFRDLAHRVQGVMDGPAIEAVTEKSLAHSACTDDYQIIINEEKLRAEYNQEAIAFIFAHEKQHANSRHNLNRRAVLKALAEIDGGALTASSLRLYNKYIRRQEVEADLCPALKNIGFAKGYKSFADRLLERQGKGRAVTHPLNTHRAQSAQTAVDYMAEYAALQLSKKRKKQDEGVVEQTTKKLNVKRNLLQAFNEADA
jgi:hypothetical protein